MKMKWKMKIEMEIKWRHCRHRFDTSDWGHKRPNKSEKLSQRMEIKMKLKLKWIWINNEMKCKCKWDWQQNGRGTHQTGGCLKREGERYHILAKGCAEHGQSRTYLSTVIQLTYVLKYVPRGQSTDDVRAWRMTARAQSQRVIVAIRWQCRDNKHSCNWVTWYHDRP